MSLHVVRRVERKDGGLGQIPKEGRGNFSRLCAPRAAKIPRCPSNQGRAGPSIVAIVLAP